LASHPLTANLAVQHRRHRCWRSWRPCIGLWRFSATDDRQRSTDYRL